MYLGLIELQHFRNYARLELTLEPRYHLLCGRNAQGKTNLLEAIYFLVTTKSPLALSDREVIAWDAASEPIPYARLRGVFHRAEATVELEATLMLEEAQDREKSARLLKQLRVNGVPRRAMDVLGQANAVLFMPQDIELVDGPPSVRRRYLDSTLCQVDSAYCRALSQFNHTVTQRNALLKRIRERESRPDELAYWDQQLVSLGARILARRQEAVAELNGYAAAAHAELTASGEALALAYAASLAERDTESRGDSPLEATDADEIAARWRRILPSLRREEIARGITVVGPHRDDLRFTVGGWDAAAYGSRGQQRTAALALKTAEMRLITRVAGERPILLLDDVASELDSARCQQLLAVMDAADQVLVTTTRLTALPQALRDRAATWRVEKGTVTPYTAPEEAPASAPS